MSRVTDQTLLEDILRHQAALPLPLLKQSAREILVLIREGLVRDGVVNISNFGSFRLKPVAARRGINPQTREAITIPAHQRVVFTPCKALRELIEPHHQPPIPIAGGSSQPRDDSILNRNGDVATAPREEHAAPGQIDTSSSNAREKMQTEVAGPLELDLGGLDDDVPSEGRKGYYRLSVAAALLFALVTAAMFVDLEEKSGPSVTTPSSTALAMTTPAPQSRPAHIMPVTAAPAGSGAAEETAPTGAVYYSEQPHQVVHGDNLWRLAASHYHAPLLWPHIYRANRETLTDPDHLREGGVLLIPSLHGAPEALTSDDRRNIAEGYYLAYLHYKQRGHHEAWFALLAAKGYDKEVVERHLNRLRPDSGGQALSAM